MITSVNSRSMVLLASMIARASRGLIVMVTGWAQRKPQKDNVPLA